MGKDRQVQHSSESKENLEPARIELKTHDGARTFWFNPERGEMGFVIFTKSFKIGGFDKDGHPVHIHCQSKKLGDICGNEWRRGYGNLNEKFEIKEYPEAWEIACKRCRAKERVEKPVILDFP